MVMAKAPGPSDVSLELISANGKTGIQVIAEFSQSTRCITNAIGIILKCCGANSQRLGRHIELQLLLSSEAYLG